MSVFLGSFSLLALWEWLSPKRELTQVKFNRWLNNLALVVCSTIVVRIIVPIAAVGVAYLVEENQWGIANTIELPFELKVLFSFILLDLFMYFQHAIFHVLPVLWRFHRVHHSDLDCDVTTGLRFHPVEMLVSILFKLTVIFALGAPVLAVILFEIVLNLMSMFNHSNIRLNNTFEKVLRWFIVTPDMHRIHHSAIENETNSNFSFNISLWDRIFGTYRLNPEFGQLNMTIGLDQYREPSWQNFKGLISMPFNSSINGYTINYRDTLNADELARVNELVNQQTKSLKQANNITEQKNIKLHKTVSRLTESEYYQFMIIENMIDGFVCIDDKGIINTFNPAAEKMFGYETNEMIGQNVSKLMSSSEAVHHDTYLADYKNKDLHHVIGIYRDIEGQRKDGSRFPIDISLSEINIHKKISFTAILRDISERKEVERKILDAKLNAEKANRAKSEFLARMSHELRTPMNAILGFGQLLSFDKESLNESQLDNVNEILSAGSHLLTLINEVLDLAKIESGKMDISIEEVNVGDLLAQCISMIGPQVNECHAELIDNVSSQGHTVQGDFTRLKQVLLNILSNSVKYNCDHGCITLNSEIVNKKYLRISITDNGKGLTTDEIDKLFKPFERLNAANNIEGTGIGLVISKYLIELMRGTMGVESVLGEGSTFWFELELSRDA